MLIDQELYQGVSFQGKEAIVAAQTARLREHLIYCKKHSPAYRTKLGKFPLDVSLIELSQLQQLPFTEKIDIEKDPESFCAVSPSAIADMVLSSGTTGEPLKIVYTENDLKRLAYNEAQSFAACGVKAGDIALLTCTLDRCFVAGLAYFLGMRRLGAASIRNGHGSLESHAAIIKKMKPTVIVGVPTFLKKLGLHLKETGIAPDKAGIARLICIGEPVRDQNLALTGTGKELQEIWRARVFSTYASSETVTTFCECTAQEGGHLLPELALVEIVDEEGHVLPAGDVGEVVMTPMAVEGMPLIRYKTGDISFLIDKPCKCGRFSPRLGPILGRKNQLMKVKGTSLYPQSVYAVLDGIEQVLDYCVVVFREADLSDQLTVHVAVKEPSVTAAWLEEQMAARLRVRPRVVIEDPKEIREKVFLSHSRKPVRFFDRRS
ncbi:MAG: AMP-binding protein [Candidatus Omnitrophota bacterium]